MTTADQKPFAFIGKYDPLRGFTVSREELAGFYTKLQGKLDEAAELEIQNVNRRPNQTDAEFEGLKSEIRNAYKIHVTIEKPGEGTISYDSADIFNPDKFPDRVASVKFDSGFKFEAIAKVGPRNRFQILFDFSKPAAFDTTVFPTHATPNNSNSNIFGQDDTWIDSVRVIIMDFIKNRKNGRSFIHRQSIYDFLLLFPGLALVFWFIFRIGSYADVFLGGRPDILTYAFYVYLFFMFLMLFRLTFHYIRWVWPLNVLAGQRDSASKHRVILGLIGVTVLGDIVRSIYALLS